MAPEILYRVIYGKSNVSSDAAASAAAAKLTIQPAILHDYCRHRVKYADYPGIVPEKGREVRGTYVTGLSDDNMAKLDTFEGSEYLKERVRVVLLRDAKVGGDVHEGVEDEVVEAKTYVFINGEGELEKVEWDYEVFRRERMFLWADKSEEYKGKWKSKARC